MNTKWHRYIQQIFFLIYMKLLATDSQEMPYLEIEHEPHFYRQQLSPFLEGTEYEIPGVELTPDFREDEPPFYAHNPKFFKEENRPYRMSPHHMQQYRWAYFNKKDNPDLMGCYCCTVYKRLTPLAGCAVLTTRHLLTTASSTELIIKERRHSNLENILGAWYDNNANVWNSSMYMTPARIHYHPRFLRPENVNVTHPIPGYFDLAVWTATYPFYGNFWSLSKTCICTRGGSHPWSYASSTPHGELLFIVGFQYVLAWKKKPLPWFKYALRTRDDANPCPKTEWGWYHCIPGTWAKFGLEPGAALHRCFEGLSWRYDGLIGINMFSMRLRSSELIHYFHPLDTHQVLDFLYSSYMGRLPYDHLDHRFYDTQWHSPYPKPWYWISWNYAFGVEHEYEELPFNY